MVSTFEKHIICRVKVCTSVLIIRIVHAWIWQILHVSPRGRRAGNDVSGQPKYTMVSAMEVLSILILYYWKSNVVRLIWFLSTRKVTVWYSNNSRFFWKRTTNMRLIFPGRPSRKTQRTSRQVLRCLPIRLWTPLHDKLSSLCIQAGILVLAIVAPTVTCWSTADDHTGLGSLSCDLPRNFQKKRTVQADEVKSPTSQLDQLSCMPIFF